MMKFENNKRKNAPNQKKSKKKLELRNSKKLVKRGGGTFAITNTRKKIKRLQSTDPNIRPSGKLEAPDTTATLQPLVNADPQDWLGSNRDPDVMLSVPNLGVDHIGLKVKNLHAHVDLKAKILDLVELHVGADVGIEEVDLQIDNVRVQAMLKVKLDKVQQIVGDVIGLLNNHPEILTNLTEGLGRGLEGALAGKRKGEDGVKE